MQEVPGHGFYFGGRCRALGVFLAKGDMAHVTLEDAVGVGLSTDPGIWPLPSSGKMRSGGREAFRC